MSELTIDRPITGDIQRRTVSRVKQEGPVEFLAAIDAVLAQDGVLAVIWDQYTPYFNDGEPCEFGTGEVYLKLEDRFIDPVEREEYEEYEDDYSEDNPTLFSEWKLHGGGDWRNPTYIVNGQDTKAIHEAFNALNLDKFEDVLQTNFGDPAQIIATKDGFTVEYTEAPY